MSNAVGEEQQAVNSLAEQEIGHCMELRGHGVHSRAAAGHILGFSSRLSVEWVFGMLFLRAMRRQNGLIEKSCCGPT